MLSSVSQGRSYKFLTRRGESHILLSYCWQLLKEMDSGNDTKKSV